MIKVPTPLQKLSHPLLTQKKIELYVKRDDLTDPDIMGNKWRKLKYNLEEAKKLGCDQLITMGGAYSNHIAATAAAASAFGFSSLGIIRGEELGPSDNPTLQFAQTKGMIFDFVDREFYRTLRKNPSNYLQDFKNAYFLPEGGTNELAIKGCKEIIPEIDIDFDWIVCPIGTGGTLCGLIDALELQQKALGISALIGDFIIKEVENLLDKYRLKKKNYEFNLTYHFGGYGKTNQDLIDFINFFKETFHIQLDPVYTGKSFFSVWDMIKRDKFEENLRIVLLHTGGLQGIEGFNRKNQNIIQ